jgi:uncharacterized membrane protein YqjE
LGRFFDILLTICCLGIIIMLFFADDYTHADKIITLCLIIIISRIELFMERKD